MGVELKPAAKHLLKFGVQKVGDEYRMQDDGEVRNVEVQDDESVYVDTNNSQIFVRKTREV